MKPIVNPSLMCMDFLDIRRQLEILNTRADLYHFDVMDGHFVPNITLSPDLAAAIAPVCALPLDIHLMVTEPGQYLEPFARAVRPLSERGIVSYFSPHAEVISGRAFRLIDQIRAAGLRPGVAVNPETPLSMIESYMHRLDKITFMSVDPGFAGQPPIPEVRDKVRQARRIKEEKGLSVILEMDGSCNRRTFRQLAQAGVESFIVGTSGLFGQDADLARAWEIMSADLSGALEGACE